MQRNEQSPLRAERGGDGSLAVHSVFQTIQGEGPFAGHAALFIRLYGCNLQCPWCDTDYTSQQERMSLDALVNTVYAYEQKTLSAYGDTLYPLVVITGGEPFRQNISPGVRELLTRCRVRVQIETNGVLYPVDFPWGHPRLTVVCSPKTARIHPETARRVDAYKYVIEAGRVAADGLPTTALGHDLGKAEHVARPPESWNGPIYIQPMDAKDEETNARNARVCAELVMRHRRYILGFQMHKYMGLP